MAAADDHEPLSPRERYDLQAALGALNDECDELQIEEIVEASGVERAAVQRVMNKQAADPLNPVEYVSDGVWRVEDE